MDIFDAYRAVVEAARKGADVTEAVKLLNAALNATEPLRSQLLQNATAIAQKAAEQAQWATAASWAATAAVAAAVILTLVNYKKILGFLFLKIYGKAKVTKGPGKPKTLLFDQEVAAILAAVATIAVAVAIAVQFKPTEPFTAIGLLGPEGKMGGYPDVVRPGQEVKLYIYVYNHMGHPAWLRVAARWLDNLTDTPSPHGFYIKELFLAHNQSTTLPITLRVNKTGVLKAELWIYTPDGQLQYTNRSVYLRIRTK